MRNIRHINIEIDKQDFIKKLGIKDVDIEDIVNKVVDKIPKTDPINVDSIVSKVIELLPKPKKSIKSKDINVDDIVAKVLLSIKMPEPKIIETIQKVDVTVPELVEKINTVDKEIDWKVLKNIPYDVLNKKGGKDHAIHRGGMSRFIQLTDVPQSYSGQGGKIVAVKSDVSGLEFIDNPEGSDVDQVTNSDGSLTISPTTGNVVASLNLGHYNTFTVTQTVNDGIGNSAVLSDGASSRGASFIGNVAGLQANDAGGTYTAILADTSSSSAGYFADSGGNYAYLAYNNQGAQFSGVALGAYLQNSTSGTNVSLASISYAVDGSGIINTNSDYYIGGSPIGVSHWSNDAGYITLAVSTLTGTASQVLVNGVAGVPTSGAITLTLPQSIATSSTPQFQRMGLGIAASATQSLSITIGTNTHKGVVVKGAASQSGNTFEIQNSSATLLSAFTSDGRLGIGGAPDAAILLHSKTSGNAETILESTGGTTPYAGYSLKSTTGKWGMFVGGSGHPSVDGDFGIYDWDAGLYRMVIKDDGKVGIGNTAPTYNFTLGTANTVTSSGGFGGASASVYQLIGNTSSGSYTQLAIQGPTNGGAAIEMYDGSGNAVMDFGMNTNASEAGFINRMTSGIMSFYTHNGSSLARRLYINATGDVGIAGDALSSPNLRVMNSGLVGIGNTAPGAKLDVNGAARYAGTSTVPTASGVGEALELWYYTGGGGPYGVVLAYDRDASAYKPIRIAGSDIGFEEGSTRVMTIDGLKVGIGETVPQTELHIRAAANPAITIASGAYTTGKDAMFFGVVTSAGGFMSGTAIGDTAIVAKAGGVLNFGVSPASGTVQTTALKINADSSLTQTATGVTNTFGSTIYSNFYTTTNNFVTNANGANYMGIRASGDGTNSTLSIGYTAAIGTLITEVLTVRDTGNVGIGTITPSAKLHTLGTTEQLRLGYDSSNYLSATVGSTGSVTVDCTGTNPTIIMGKKLRLKGYTVATLPAGTQGDTAFVTDALAPAFLGALVGGGAVVTTVFHNGTNWIVA